jgi:hypothetical protein
LSETRFSSDPPANGTRVEIVPDGGSRHHVNVWINGRLIDSREFQSKETAEHFAEDEQRRIHDASRS